PGDGEERVRATTARMDADLRELLVEGDSHEERRLIARIAEMLANDAGDATLHGWNTIGRQVELAGRTLRTVDERLVARVAETVAAYYAELGRLGMQDGHAAPTPREPSSWLRRIAIAPLAASGFALYAIPYFIPRFVARKTDRDAVSTIKLGAALVVYPVWAAGLVTASFVMLPPPLSLVAAFVAIASPFAALEWLDDYWQRRPHVSGDELASLARLRIAARTAIDEARAKLPS
ncbi:MAG TPA: hypothetical protein VGO00_02195, partial [Kofleriaceae bacterium]|nr:hypothetical protein [Kofleriaceae bacterium]